MLKKLKKAYDELLKSKRFEKDGFLCGAFIMCKPDELENQAWQIDFYDPSKDEMITYKINDNIEVERSKAFKNEYEIERLNIDDVKFDFDKALKKSLGVLSRYKDSANNIVIVLQKIKNLMWNITYVTNNFNLLNIKIDATNGKILDKKSSSMFQFKKNQN